MERNLIFDAHIQRAPSGEVTATYHFVDEAGRKVEGYPCGWETPSVVLEACKPYSGAIATVHEVNEGGSNHFEIFAAEIGAHYVREVFEPRKIGKCKER